MFVVEFKVDHDWSYGVICGKVAPSRSLKVSTYSEHDAGDTLLL